MSILTQILKDMYIDPDLLTELSEDQKQLLFCKMREEQVRRWLECEKKLEEEDTKKKKKAPKPLKPAAKRVNWLNGLDNKEWVWVMGDHINDKSIDDMLEEEASTKAAKQAEIDALKLRENEEAEVKQQLKAEEERLKKELQEQEALAKKKAEEAAVYQSIKEARLSAAKLETEKKELARKEKEQFELEQKKKRGSIHTLEELKTRRRNDLYMTWKQLRQSIEKEAIESSRIVDEEWMEQEKKSKAAELKIRDLARKARVEHRKSVNSVYTILEGSKSLPNHANKQSAPAPPLPQKTSKDNQNKMTRKNAAPRPPRPTSKESVIRWFREEEMPKGTEKTETGKIETWFHGIISRICAEDLLDNYKVGAFLVRVSEKIWGYTITYKEESRCKHFLIDAADGQYHFFGTDQIKHATLKELIKHHKTTPISLEQEILITPCGQSCDPPDYHELYSTNKSESTPL